MGVQPVIGEVNLDANQLQSVGNQIAESQQQLQGIQEKDDAERERMTEQAGTEGDSLCPSGRAECVRRCNIDNTNSLAISGCVERCIDFCKDPTDMSDFDACPEGKPRCAKACEDMAGTNDEQRTGCKARCVNSCCPRGIATCKEECDQKPDPQQKICKALCDENCQK